MHANLNKKSIVDAKNIDVILNRLKATYRRKPHPAVENMKATNDYQDLR